MQLTRILAAFSLIPFLLFLILKGTYLHYALFIAALALVGLIEYYGLVKTKINMRMKVIGILWGLLIAGAFCTGNLTVAAAVITFGFLGVFLARLSYVGQIASVLEEIGYTFMGPLYVGLLFGHVALLRSMVDGRAWTLLLLVTVWMGDTFALYTGMALGRNKLYPEISPNKTIEGALGGIIGSIIVVFAAKKWFLTQLTITDTLVIALGCAIMGQLGDLCESMVKRAAGAKDSGVLIPGHGGILDRFDSILFSAPFLYYYLVLIKGLD